MEHGAIIAATVPGSPRAVEISVYVIRAFVQLRELLKGRNRSRRSRVYGRKGALLRWLTS